MITIPMQVAVNKVTLPMTVTATRQLIPMAVSASYVVSGAPYYEGDYEITPRLYQQSFDTDGKLMQDDLTVYEIPVARTTNPTGGLTVLIG